MIRALVAGVLASLGCTAAPLHPAVDPMRLICWTTETRHIADDDPALALFTDEPTLADRKIALAIERINGCDIQEPKP